MAQARGLFDALYAYWEERLPEIPEDRSVLGETIVRTCIRYRVTAIAMGDAFAQARRPSDVLALVDGGAPEDRPVREKLAGLVLDWMQTAPEDMFASLNASDGVDGLCFEAALRAMWGPRAFAQ